LPPLLRKGWAIDPAMHDIVEAVFAQIAGG